MRPKILIAGKVLLLIVLLLLLMGSISAAPPFQNEKSSARDQDFQIRTRVDLVVVPVTVKGAKDRLITGLTKDDFILMEDGQRQTITNFTTDPVPLSAVILVDTGLSAGSLSKVQQTFPALAGAFSEFDEVALYRFDKFVAKVLDFSRDSVALETSMKTLKDIKGDPMPYQPPPGGPFSVPGPVINGRAVVPAGQVAAGSSAPPKKIKVLNDAVFAAASDLKRRETNRRKMVLIISDGYNEGSDHSFDDAVKSLLENGVEVYAVGVEQSFLTKPFSVLNRYAAVTGGDTYSAGSIQNIEQSYNTAAEAARNQYVLGYISRNKVQGVLPIFRDIQVTVAKAGFETLHRKGYYQYP